MWDELYTYDDDHFIAILRQFVEDRSILARLRYLEANPEKDHWGIITHATPYLS